MFEKLIDEIQKAVVPPMIGINGHEYLSQRYHLPPEEPRVDPIRVSTLSGFVDYLTANFDQIPDCMIHVVSPVEVQLVGQLKDDRYHSRQVYAIAELPTKQPTFGRYQPTEQFVINLMTQFADVGDRAEVLKVVGNLRHDSTTRTQDDGVTQTATLKTGIALVQEAPVSPIQTLAPYRTFREVNQPSSAFLLRIKQEKDGVHAALFEADGEQWKLDAIAAIKEWLSERIDADDPIIA